MGVPYFFKKLLDSERKYKKKILQEKIESDVDILYIDGNCAIHPQCFQIADDMIDTEDVYEKEEKMIKQVIKYFDIIEEYVKPKKQVFLAIDGVAPMAKINQQRKRRVKSVLDNSIRGEIKLEHGKKISNWSNAVISPGTEFMERLHLKLIKHYKNKKSDIEYVYSSYHTKGEGEHKILQDIKKRKTEKSVIYGLDADLIFLCMSSNVKELYLLREYDTFKTEKSTVKDNQQNFIYVSIDNVKKIINYEISEKIAYLSEKPYKIKNYVNDYIFICFLIGNDFLPHPPSIDIRKDGLEMIIDAYCTASIKINDTIIDITTNNVKINFKMFCEVIKNLSNREFDYFTQIYPNFMSKNSRKKCFSKNKYDIEIWKLDNLININIEDPIKLGHGNSIEWKHRYYKHHFNITNRNEIDKIVKIYLEGLKWVAVYYFNSCENWKWFYPYDHMPFISDIYKYISQYDNIFDKIKFKKNKHLEILTQLMVILPIQYSYILPSSYNKLLKSEDSSIKDMFPQKIELDYLYKDMYWQCEPKLPIIDIKRVHEETKKLKVSSNSNERNQNLSNFKF